MDMWMVETAKGNAFFFETEDEAVDCASKTKGEIWVKTWAGVWVEYCEWLSH